MVSVKIILNLVKNNIVIQLFVLLLAALVFGKYFPPTFQSFFYALSLTLNNLLIAILPVIIFFCLFISVSSLRLGQGFWLMLILIAVVLASNFFSTLIAYGVGSLKIINTHIPIAEAELNKSLIPLWSLKFPRWMSNTTALMLGLGVGVISSFFRSTIIQRIREKSTIAFNWFFSKVFIRVLPLIIFGYILNMEHRGILTYSLQSCLSLFLLISVICILYLSLLFLIISNFNIKRGVQYIKNTLPAAITGFSTMSSLATMPVTLEAAEKNTGNSNVGLFVIPTTVNIHLIGLAVGIPLMALTLITNFGMECPPFGVYLQFALSFIITQFAITPTPASGIIMMIPLLESYLGFTGEMSAIIIGLYILMDPIETSANVVGNSILTIFMAKLFPSFGQK